MWLEFISRNTSLEKNGFRRTKLFQRWKWMALRIMNHFWSNEFRSDYHHLAWIPLVASWYTPARPWALKKFSEKDSMLQQVLRNSWTSKIATYSVPDTCICGQVTTLMTAWILGEKKDQNLYPWIKTQENNGWEDGNWHSRAKSSEACSAECLQRWVLEEQTSALQMPRKV